MSFLEDLGDDDPRAVEIELGNEFWTLAEANRQRSSDAVTLDLEKVKDAYASALRNRVMQKKTYQWRLPRLENRTENGRRWIVFTFEGRNPDLTRDSVRKQMKLTNAQVISDMTNKTTIDRVNTNLY